MTLEVRVELGAELLGDFILYCAPKPFERVIGKRALPSDGMRLTRPTYDICERVMTILDGGFPRMAIPLAMMRRLNQHYKKDAAFKGGGGLQSGMVNLMYRPKVEMSDDN